MVLRRGVAMATGATPTRSEETGLGVGLAAAKKEQPVDTHGATVARQAAVRQAAPVPAISKP